MTKQKSRHLLEMLAEVPDSRKSQGKRHPLPVILGLTVVAMLCGYRSYSAVEKDTVGYKHARLLPAPPSQTIWHARGLHKEIAYSLRYFASLPEEALKLIGIDTEN